MSHIITLALDDQAFETLGALKKAFGVTSPGEVFRKCMAVASYATKQAETSEGVIVMRGDAQGVEDEIRVLLR